MRGLNVGEFASLASDLQVTDYTLTWTAVRADRLPDRRTDRAQALCPAEGRVLHPPVPFGSVRAFGLCSARGRGHHLRRPRLCRRP